MILKNKPEVDGKIYLLNVTFSIINRTGTEQISTPTDSKSSREVYDESCQKRLENLKVFCAQLIFCYTR